MNKSIIEIEYLIVTLTQNRHGKPLATVRNFPGLDADMTPAQMRAMAAALEAAATECEQRPMGKRYFHQIVKNYPMELRKKAE